MKFCCTLHDSVAEIADDEWEQATGSDRVFAADRRLIVALERALVGQARCKQLWLHPTLDANVHRTLGAK